MLDVIGLDPTAELVYRYLVTARQAGTEDVAAGTGLAAAQAQAVLRELEATGLVSRAPGSRPQYRATDPAIALDLLVMQREEALKRIRLGIEDLAAQFHAARSFAHPAELVEIVTGQEAIVQRVHQVTRSARTSVRVLDRPPYLMDPTEYNTTEHDLIRRGVVARVVYDRAAVEVPGRRAILEHDVARGEEARVLTNLPTKLVLVDDRIGLVPLQTVDEVADSYVVVHRSGLLDALHGLFEILWRLALPLNLAGTRSDGLSPDEQRVLALMAAGLPDEAIGRQLGLSERTLRRRVQGLMDRLQVRSRFQLGMHAADLVSRG